MFPHVCTPIGFFICNFAAETRKLHALRTPHGNATHESVAWRFILIRRANDRTTAVHPTICTLFWADSFPFDSNSFCNFAY